MDAASSAATPPARTACAAAAQPPADGAAPRVPGDAERAFCDETQALQDGASFVSAVSARESLVDIAVKLLRSEDERIKQRTWERLVTIGPGRGSAAEETGQMIWDIPRPIRD